MDLRCPQLSDPYHQTWSNKIHLHAIHFFGKSNKIRIQYHRHIHNSHRFLPRFPDISVQFCLEYALPLLQGASRASSPVVLSRNTSRAPSRAPSQAPSRAPSCGPSGAATPEVGPPKTHQQLRIQGFTTRDMVIFCSKVPPPPPLSPLERCQCVKSLLNKCFFLSFFAGTIYVKRSFCFFLNSSFCGDI